MRLSGSRSWRCPGTHPAAERRGPELEWRGPARWRRPWRPSGVEAYASAVRVFAGLWPSPDAVAELARFERPELPGVRWTTPAQWHVTMRFFGEIELAGVEDLIEALASAARRSSPLRASIGPCVCRFVPGILAVKVAGVDGLAAEIRRATASVGNGQGTQRQRQGLARGDGERGSGNGNSGDPQVGQPFAGHLTLARYRVGAAVRDLVGRPLRASWLVEDMALIASELQPTGSRYRDLARIRLAAGSGGPVVSRPEWPSPA